MFRRPISRALLIPRTPAPRYLSTTRSLFASKDAQDKDSLKPRSTEYSKSGSDDAAAESGAAFDPNTTSPEAAERQSEQESGGSSLNVSPGNQEVSKPRDNQEGGAQEGVRTKVSGGGSAPKSGGSKSG